MTPQPCSASSIAPGTASPRAWTRSPPGSIPDATGHESARFSRRWRSACWSCCAAFADGSAVLRHDGQTTGTSDLDELWLAVRRRPQSGLQASDPVDVRATLGRVAETGPYFTVGTGPAAGPGWQPMRRLYDDPVLLAALVDRLRNRLVATEQRVAVSTLFLGYAARLWSVGLGALVSTGCAVDLDPDLLLWKDDDAAVRLHVEQPQGWQGAGVEVVLHRHVVQDHLGPLITALHRLGPLSGATTSPGGRSGRRRAARRRPSASSSTPSAPNGPPDSSS